VARILPVASRLIVNRRAAPVAFAG
jgi:hypothetical protein